MVHLFCLTRPAWSYRHPGVAQVGLWVEAGMGAPRGGCFDTTLVFSLKGHGSRYVVSCGSYVPIPADSSLLNCGSFDMASNFCAVVAPWLYTSNVTNPVS